jgi:hypothetical protein
MWYSSNTVLTSFISWFSYSITGQWLLNSFISVQLTLFWYLLTSIASTSALHLPYFHIYAQTVFLFPSVFHVTVWHTYITYSLLIDGSIVNHRSSHVKRLQHDLFRNVNCLSTDHMAHMAFYLRKADPFTATAVSAESGCEALKSCNQ